MAVAISLACFALIAVMCMQFKIVNQTNITEIENMRETELRTELANWKQKYEETEKKYEETQNMLEEYKKTQESNEETEKIVDAELEQVNRTLGKTDVEGDPLQVVLKEAEDNEVGKIKADSLLIIVNALKAAGAEAI